MWSLANASGWLSGNPLVDNNDIIFFTACTCIRSFHWSTFQIQAANIFNRQVHLDSESRTFHLQETCHGSTHSWEWSNYQIQSLSIPKDAPNAAYNSYYLQIAWFKTVVYVYIRFLFKKNTTLDTNIKYFTSCMCSLFFLGLFLSNLSHTCDTFQ